MISNVSTVTEFAIMCLISLVLVGGWVGAWLNWIFVGHLRHYALATLPSKIRNIDRATLASLTHGELQNYIICDLEVPEFFRRLLTCPTCCSFHCAWIGFLVWSEVLYQAGILTPSISWSSLLLIPASAALGLHIHFRTHN